MAAKTHLKSALAISLFSLLLLFSTTAQVNTTTVAPNSFSIVKNNIEYYMQTDKVVYDVGETVEMLYRITNVGKENAEFIFTYGPLDNTCDWMVDQDGIRIWDNLDRPGTSVMTSFNLGPSQSYEYMHTWDMTDNDGDNVSLGNYTVTGALGYYPDHERYVPVSVHIDIIQQPGTHYVKSGESIQTRIDDPNVVDGDIIIVFPGTYFENINFNGKNITLRSTDPNDPNVVAATIIDGGQNGSVVTFNSGEDANCVLNGFTITNGYAEFGGGIYCASPPLPPPPGPPPPPPPPPPLPPGILNEQSSPEILSETNLTAPTITNCIINNNSADSGGGMSNYQSNPALTNCTFSGNYANTGGGMYNNESSPILNNCTFAYNSAKYGSGVYVYWSSPALSNCIFRGNSGKNGAGIYCNRSNPSVTYCAFDENTASEDGGGIYNEGSSPTLTSCLFSGNKAYSGGGMHNEYSGAGLVSCTFIGNWASGEGGAIRWLPNISPPPPPPLGPFSPDVMGSSSIGANLSISDLNDNSITYPMITNCIFWDNMAGDCTDESAQISVDPNEMPIIIRYSCVQGWTGTLGGTGNIGEDPFFVAPGHFEPNCIFMHGHYYCTYDWIGGDYLLCLGSPCINTGDPNYEAEPNETDLDGRPRIIGGRIDMGAYEYALLAAEVRIMPNTLNLVSKRDWIKGYMWLPEGHNVDDIDSKSIVLNGKIQAESVQVNEQQKVVIAKFSYYEVRDILNVGEVDLTITARLTDGILLEGTDVIKVITESGGKLAKIGEATNPDPPDGTAGVGITAVLSWTPNPSAASHDVYFGMSSPPPFVGNQTDAEFDPGTMAYGTTYYWRIDEVNKWGTATGDLWSFATMGIPPQPP